MHGGGPERRAEHRSGRDDIFDRIGHFLTDQGLSPDPANYSFAYAVFSDPTGALANAVDRLTDGGVRLSAHDIERFGGTAIAGGLVRPAPAEPGKPDAAALVAETQAQVAGFAEIMRTMHDETRGFGRDLAQSAAAITRAPAIGGLDEIARLTGGMIDRIRESEVRLLQATEETDALRAKLAEANDTARRDTLTGLANRRAFDEAFLAREAVPGPACLSIVDIDHFKLLNDGHGHAVGDRVLSAIARLLAESCAGHLVSRHGGEEFAVLLSGTTLDEATAILEHARATIGARRFRTRENDAPIGRVTVSAGVTAIRPGERAAVALERADRLLYTAKADGRDRVRAA